MVVSLFVFDVCVGFLFPFVYEKKRGFFNTKKIKVRDSFLFLCVLNASQNWKHQISLVGSITKTFKVFKTSKTKNNKLR